MTENYAKRTVKNWRCHCCWGDLEKIQIEPGKWEVRCRRAALGLCSGGGFVSQHYVNKRLQQDAIDYQDARYNLKNILFPARPKANERELLQDLGF